MNRKERIKKEKAEKTKYTTAKLGLVLVILNILDKIITWLLNLK